MAKLFYDHLVVIEEIITELDNHNISPLDRRELLDLMDQTLHHHVLNTILKHLPYEKHEKFLIDLHSTPHDRRLMDYLKAEIKVDIEEKIKEETAKIKKEILAEIKKAKVK